MADAAPWRGGKPPGGVSPYKNKQDLQIGWRFRILGAEAEKLPRHVPRSKQFTFKVHGDGAKAAAEDYQRQIAEDHGLEFKNQYRHREDPNDGLPYIEFHIKDKSGKDYYPMCDVGDLSLLEEHTWSVYKNKKNLYVRTTVEIDGKQITKGFHSFKYPEWPMVDHYSKIPEENRNGLDNRSKHLRDGSGGVNEGNCRLKKNNKSGVNGVSYDNTRKAWRAQTRSTRARLPSKYYYGPEDKTHPSYDAACAYAREQAAKIGRTNGQMPPSEASDSDGEEDEKEAMAAYLTILGL